MAPSPISPIEVVNVGAEDESRTPSGSGVSSATRLSDERLTALGLTFLNREAVSWRSRLCLALLLFPHDVRISSSIFSQHGAA